MHMEDAKEIAKRFNDTKLQVELFPSKVRDATKTTLRNLFFKIWESIKKFCSMIAMVCTKACYHLHLR